MKLEALDIETIWINNIAKPICIAITNNNKILFKKTEIKNINKNEIMWFLIENCKNNKIYYVHNLTFEGLVFLRSFIENDIKFEIISHNKTIYSIKIKYLNKTIKLRCSYRLTLLSLKDLAKLSQINEKTPFPYKILNIDLKETMNVEEKHFNSLDDFNKFKNKNGTKIKTYEILEEYCKNDVIITKKAIQMYWNIIKSNGLKDNGRILTAAKLSIENFFMQKTKVKRKISLKLDRILRKSYFGGRTEVFGNPYDDEKILHYDWSGMYAQCMCEKIPGGEVFISNQHEDVKEPGFYYIKFKQKMNIPILPIKEDKLYFKNGTFEGWYWFEEIILFIEMGGNLIEIRSAVKFEYYDRLLENFVLLNNKIRKLGTIHKQIGKNNNNTFYGRLGMNPERLEEVILTDKDKKPKNYEKLSENLGITTAYVKKEKTTSNVSISAAITSKARIKLYKGFIEIEKNGGRMLYCDTDSIIAAFKKDNYKNIINKQMGEVMFNTNENDTEIKDAVFCMPKTYGIKLYNDSETVKIKGFTKTPRFNELKESFYKKEIIETKNEQWHKKDFQIEIKNIIKHTNLNQLNKRSWTKNMKETKPLEN